MSERIADAVYAALARQLGCEPAALRAAAARPLEELGLDSHGLMRVLLDIEGALGLSNLDLPDEALASPAAMVAGVAAVA